MTDARGGLQPEKGPEDSHIRKRMLPVRSPRAPLSRHPDDGFELAEPYPLGHAARRALRALIVIMCPSAPAPNPPDMVDRLELHLRRFMAYMPRVAAFAMWLSVMILDWSPVFLFQSIHRMHALGRARASALITEMVSGRFSFLRSVVVAVRGLTLSAYFDQEEVHRAIGYSPLPFLRERIERRRLLLAAPEPAFAAAGGRR